MDALPFDPDQFEEHGYAVIDDFVAAATVRGIREELLHLEQEGALRRAGIGKDDQLAVNDAQRGDFIHWIDPAEVAPATAVYLERLGELVRWMNRSFYLGLKDFECHYASYPPGTFYKRHSDRHKSGSSRRVSLVFYLNEGWEESDGGALRLYPEGGGQVDIQPLAGRLALFLSHMEHEVLITHRTRQSVTGWMLDEKVF